MKLTNLHIAVSSFAAIAGVAIAAYQAFAPAPAGQQPVQVTLALDPQQAATGGETAKSDGGPMLQTAAIALEKNAHVAAAFKDGSETRYAFASLFDGKPETSLTILPPDSEVNVVMEFQSTSAQLVTAIQYTPPPGADPMRLASKLDVMVLPDGQLEASGRPVMSFTLQQSAESQTFAIPGAARGRGLWLRIAGDDNGKPVVVGDFSVLREQLSP